MNRARPWLPALLALSANSPFWLGRDTGYASYRSELFGRFPMTGVPAEFDSRAHFDELVASLVAVGAIEDGSKLYWDIRPSSHFETLEFRVADACSTVDETVMIAGLCRALAVACLDGGPSTGPPVGCRPEMLRAAKWRAARFGLEGDLVDPVGLKTIPAREVIRSFLTFLRPTLEALGEWGEVSGLVERILAEGNGAIRQRRAFESLGTMTGVVDRLIEDTSEKVS
jgi:carboxylate-amine ligase